MSEKTHDQMQKPTSASGEEGQSMDDGMSKSTRGDMEKPSETPEPMKRATHDMPQRDMAEPMGDDMDDSMDMP